MKIKNLVYLNPFHLDGFSIYIEALKDLANKFNEYKSTKFDITKDGKLFQFTRYRFQSILADIFLFLPVKVSHKSENDIKLYISKENIFSTDVNYHFYTEELKKVVYDEYNKPFFFSNYFFRNAYYHQMFSTDTKGHFGTLDYISNFEFIIYDTSSLNSSEFISKLYKNIGDMPIKNRYTVKFEKDVNGKLSLTASFSIISVSLIINQIITAFKNATISLLQFVTECNSDVLFNYYNVEKSRYIKVLNHWYENLERIVLN